MVGPNYTAPSCPKKLYTTPPSILTLRAPQEEEGAPDYDRALVLKPSLTGWQQEDAFQAKAMLKTMLLLLIQSRI